MKKNNINSNEIFVYYKTEILKTYKQELNKRRRPEQVSMILKKDKRLKGYIEKCANNLLNWNIDNPSKFIRCQFFSLNYMPYLPNMMHISSEKSLERWEKYKDWFEKKIGFEEKNKKNKRLHKNINKEEKELYLNYLKINKIEEEDKKIKHNDLIGFSICIESTTLFNKYSKHCLLCNFKKDCKKILQKKIPPLFLKRNGKISEENYFIRMKKFLDKK